jgi:molybdopterin-guanine dinucleotide biosynthesis protein A
MTDAPAAVILAGGQSRRMGGDEKTLQQFGPGSVLSAIIGRLSPQVADLAINANGDPARFNGFGLMVIADVVGGRPGPLAGILSAIDWARDFGSDWVVTVPSDTPFLPCDLVPRLLWAAEAGASVVIASSNGIAHPTVALWSTALRDDLASTLERGERKVQHFVERHNAAVVAFPGSDPDPFFNINTPEDLKQARTWV